MAQLVNQRDRTAYDLITNPVSIGRHPSNELVLQGGTMSRFHAVITAEDEVFFIEDQHSTFGTYVNDVKVEGRVRLNNDDRVQFGRNQAYPDGEYDLVFSTKEAPGGAAQVQPTGMTDIGQTSVGQVGNALVIQLTGAFRKVEIENTVQFALLRTKNKSLHVIFDMDKVTFLNKQCMFPMVNLWTQQKAKGNRFILAGAHGPIEELLRSLGFADQFGLYPTVDEALAELGISKTS